ncbi:MAG: glutathione transferase GstA [Roseateles sp.]|uniref:glutathione transferase GstA n=1 Tax=Roseateles sp. TaxID=1971397 RepID=UPI00403717E3
MKLYYAPGACSLASHIVLRETSAPFTLTRVNLARHRVEDDGRDFYALTAKGQVPLLELADGTRISEGPVVMQYIADTGGAHELLPPPGTLARLRVLEWCNHLTSEIHKSFTPLFHGHVDGTAAQTLRGLLKKKLAFLDEQLADKRHLTGDAFTVADAYLFVLLGWCPPVQLDISDLARLNDFQARVADRPAVQAAMKAEGLLH